MSRWWRYGRLIFVALSAAGLWTASAVAQELVPRAYWPAPKGTNLLVFGYQYSSGDIVSDATLPVTGVDSKLNYAQATYQRTLDLFGRTSNIQFSLPYTWGSTEGIVEGEYRRRNVSGAGDASALLSVNLLGAPSMDGAGMQALRADPRTIIGASLMVRAPTGAYDKDKVINEGTNRWAVKLETGLIWPVHPKWLIEVDIGAWFFTDNDDFLGTTRQQDPILSGQIHLVKRFRPGFWASLDMNFYRGGETTVGGTQRDDLQRNSRLGGTLVVPVFGRSAIRASYSTGVVTESGGDFDSVDVSYVHAW